MLSFRSEKMEIAKKAVPHWSTLRKLGQSKIVSVTIFVPVIGYMILLNDNIVEYFALSERLLSDSLAEDNSLPSVDATFRRLRLIYLGLVSVGIASFIFKIRCPSEILEHQNEYDFVRAELEIMTSERFKSVQKRLAQWRTSVPQELEEGVNAVRDAELSETLQRVTTTERSLIWDDWLNRNRKIMSTALSVLYGVLKQDLLSYRIIIFSLYIIGFLTMLWPSLGVFWTILTSTLREFV